jgi:hypothetical protein
LPEMPSTTWRRSGGCAPTLPDSREQRHFTACWR